jgi:Transposase C of IS166 homeodomain
MPNDALPDDLETLKAMLLAERCESERLRQIIKELQRHRFGRRAETLPEEQMLLGLEEVEQVEASDEAKQDENAPDSRAARGDAYKLATVSEAIYGDSGCTHQGPRQLWTARYLTLRLS